MVKIRLRRTGAKKQPSYRVVVTDAKSPRDGKFIENIGNYNPRTDPPTVEIDAERAIYWLRVGAQPSEAVRRMLDKLGIISRAEAIKRGEVLVREHVAEPEQVKAAPKKKVERPSAGIESEIEEEPVEELEEFDLDLEDTELEEDALEYEDEEPDASELDESDDLDFEEYDEDEDEDEDED
jgi:small subunit ribosomal protein S16